ASRRRATFAGTSSRTASSLMRGCSACCGDWRKEMKWDGLRSISPACKKVTRCSCARGNSMKGKIESGQLCTVGVGGFVPLFVPTPSEGFEPVVLDARLRQGGGEAVPVEVGMLSGAGEAPDVRQRLDPVLGEKGHEPLQGVVRVADGENR